MFFKSKTCPADELVMLGKEIELRYQQLKELRKKRAEIEVQLEPIKESLLEKHIKLYHELESELMEVDFEIEDCAEAIQWLHEKENNANKALYCNNRFKYAAIATGIATLVAYICANKK